VATSTPSVMASDRSIPTWVQVDGVDTILAEKHDRPIVNLNLTFGVGSASDPDGKEGLANLMGEMLLRGTRSHTREEIENMLDYLGATLEVSTGFHSTTVEGQVLTRNLEPLVALMVELLSEPVFPDGELRKLKEETTAQLYLRLEDDAGLARLNFNRAVYSGHPYARDPIGTLKSIEAIGREDVAGLFGKWIHRGGMLVGAAGDISRPTLDGIVRKIVGKLAAGETKGPVEPFRGRVEGRNVLLVDKPERTQTQFVIGHPGIDAKDPDFFPLSVFVTAFSGHMFQATYMQEIRVKRGWSYGAYGSIDARRDGGSFYLYTFPKVADTIPALQLSLDLLDKAIAGNVTDAQIDFAKRFITRSFPFLVDTPEKVIGQRIYQRLLGRPADYLEKYVGMVEAVTPAAARAAAKKRLSSGNLEIIIVCTASDFAKTVGPAVGARKVETIPYDRM
jgi:zinc protease